MNAKQIVLSLVAVDFAALTAYALYDVGFMAMMDAATSSSMAVTLAVDLVLSLSLGVWWMVRDGRRLGINPLPYAVVTALTGSLGLLLFLIKREGVLGDARAAASPGDPGRAQVVGA